MRTCSLNLPTNNLLTYYTENMMRVLENKKQKDLEPSTKTSLSQEEREKMRAIEKQLLHNTLKMLDIY